MKRRTFFTAILILLMTSAALSQQVLTLEEVLSATYQKNLFLQQSRLSTEIADNTASLANAGLLPRVDVSSTGNMVSATTQTQAGEVDYESSTMTAGVNASYTLFNGLQGLTTYKLLNKQAEAARLQEQLVAENTLLATSSLFVNVLISHDQLEIMKDQLDISRQRLEQSRQLNEMGVSSSLATLAAQVDFDLDSAAVVEAEYVYQEACRSLNLHVGWDLDETYQPQKLEMEFGRYEAQTLSSMAGEHNVEYRIALISQEQTELQLKSTLGSMMPSVSLSGSYSAQQNNDDLGIVFENPDLSMAAGVSLSWNLFDGRKKKSIESGRIQQKSSALNTLDSERQLQEDIQSALSNFEKSLQVLSLKEHSLTSAQLNFDQTSEYYRLGQASSTDFRSAQLNLSLTKSSEVQARYTAYLAEMTLWQLSGELVDRTLSLN